MKYRTHWVSGRFSGDADASWDDIWRTIEKWERAAKRNPRIEILTETEADPASHKNNYDPGSHLLVEIRTYVFEDSVEDAWASGEWQEAWKMSERVWKDISKEFFGMADDVKSDYDIRGWRTKRSSLSDKVAKLASDHPELRAHLIPLLRKHARIRDWKMRFPYHDVEDKLDALYPWNLPTGNKVPDHLVKQLERPHSVWANFTKELKDAVEWDPTLRKVFALASAAQIVFDRLLRSRKVDDWVTLNSKIKKTHQALYRR